MYTLFTDTDCDITSADAAEYGCRLISMPFTLHEQTVWPFRDANTFDYTSFYDGLRHGALPTTGGLSPEMYTELFEPEFQAGRDILYVHFSAAMTSTFDSMNLAVRELQAKYPERRFETVDTMGITTISFVIAREVCKMYRDGKSMDEVLVWARQEIGHYAMYFFADSLDFFRRSGRVSGLSAVMGNVLNIRPIIHMSAEGKMVSIGKERGQRRTMERLVDHVIELGEDLENHPIVIGHTDALPLAQKLGDILCERLYKDIHPEYRIVNPTAGGHCGPDGVGICFHAKHR